MSTKLDEINKKIARLKLQADAIKAREAKAARALDTRRKILAGAVVLARIERGQLQADEWRAWLDTGLVRERDRTLFGLPPAPGGKKGDANGMEGSS